MAAFPEIARGLLASIDLAINADGLTDDERGQFRELRGHAQIVLDRQPQRRTSAPVSPEVAALRAAMIAERDQARAPGGINELDIGREFDALHRTLTRAGIMTVAQLLEVVDGPGVCSIPGIGEAREKTITAALSKWKRQYKGGTR